ncbi:MAG: hypothetical protein K2Y29_14860 [Beijerinckiaceae bacterium]|nr:hypothetical protein [Beijerinckiaceae bacterium]
MLQRQRAPKTVARSNRRRVVVNCDLPDGAMKRRAAAVQRVGAFVGVEQARATAGDEARAAWR